MRRKNRKLYVTVSLVAIAGLILTSVVGIFAGAGDLLHGPEQGRQEERPGLQEMIDGAKRSADQVKEILRDDPNNSLWLEELGKIYFQLGRLYFAGLGDLTTGIAYFEKSVEAYKRALEIKPENVDMRIDMAIAAYHAGDNELTGKTFREAIAQDPSHPNAHFGYAFFLYHALEDAAGAVRHWEKVLELREGFDPEKYPLVDEGVFDETVRFLEHAVRSLEEKETGN